MQSHMMSHVIPALKSGMGARAGCRQLVSGGALAAGMAAAPGLAPQCALDQAIPIPHMPSPIPSANLSPHMPCPRAICPCATWSQYQLPTCPHCALSFEPCAVASCWYHPTPCPLSPVLCIQSHVIPAPCPLSPVLCGHTCAGGAIWPLAACSLPVRLSPAFRPLRRLHPSVI